MGEQQLLCNILILLATPKNLLIPRGRFSFKLAPKKISKDKKNPKPLNPALLRQRHNGGTDSGHEGLQTKKNVYGKKTKAKTNRTPLDTTT